MTIKSTKTDEQRRAEALEAVNNKRAAVVKLQTDVKLASAKAELAQMQLDQLTTSVNAKYPGLLDPA